MADAAPGGPERVPLGGVGHGEGRKKALYDAGVRPEDLAAFVPHQANGRIIDEFAKQLGLPDTVKIARDIETTGNTSAASIPLATTSRLLQENPELSGGLSLQIGFGAGLVYAAQVVVLPELVYVAIDLWRFPEPTDQYSHNQGEITWHSAPKQAS